MTAKKAQLRRQPQRIALLDNGFRPFFLGAATWAVVAIAIWVLDQQGFGLLENQADPLFWHKHEMVFGYTGAVIAGFLLTAIPNWTGRLPVKGLPLLYLFLVWLLGRLVMLAGTGFSWILVLLVEGAFLLGMTALTGREILIGRNWRNMPVVLILLVFAIANLTAHAEAAGVLASAFGIDLGLATIVLLISLIGGRIIPSFTRNWLAKQQVADLPAPFGRYDKLSLALTLVTMIAWLSWPDARATSSLLLACGIFHAIRVLRWRGWRCFAQPLVLILHLGYAWLPVAFLLLGVAGLTSWIDSSAALHALSAGAIGTMTLAVMTRASLGHTGQPLEADAPTRTIYLFVVLGALLRVLATTLPFPYNLTLVASGLLWSGAFLLFVLHYQPLLARR